MKNKEREKQIKKRERKKEGDFGINAFDEGK